MKKLKSYENCVNCGTKLHLSKMSTTKDDEWICQKCNKSLSRKKPKARKMDLAIKCAASLIVKEWESKGLPSWFKVGHHRCAIVSAYTEGYEVARRRFGRKESK